MTIRAGQASATFTITGVDDSDFDGNKPVTITASANGHAGASGVVTVLDDEAPTLAVVIDAAQMSEAGGRATATVTRDSPTSVPLTVVLVSSDLSEARPPIVVTIPTGSVSVPFTIWAENDPFADGSQTVTITAAAGGYTSGTDTIVVTDNESAGLSLTFDRSSMSESGTATATVSRNSSTASSLSVNVSSSDMSEAIVDSTLVIPMGELSKTFTITAANDSDIDGDQPATITVSAAGHNLAARTITVTDNETESLTLTINATSISENGGTATGTVTRNSPTNSPLHVALSSSDSTEAVVPAGITIPSGAQSATFIIAAVNDGIADSNQTATVTASASGHQSASRSITIADGIVMTLTRSPAEVAEDGSSNLIYTFRRAGNTSTAVTASFTVGGTATYSSDYSQSGATSFSSSSGTVQFSSGQTVKTVTIDPSADSSVENDESVKLTLKTSASYVLGTDTSATGVIKNDDVVQALSMLVGQSPISEGSGNTSSTLTITRNGSLDSPLTVNLSSSDPSAATFPSPVTIDRNKTTVVVLVSAVDNSANGPNNIVTFTASASGFQSSVGSVEILDDDPSPELDLRTTETFFRENTSISATITREHSDTSSPLTVYLTSSDTSGATVPSSVTIPSGSVTKSFTVTGVNDTAIDGSQTVVIQATADGLFSDRQTLTVLDDEVARLTLSLGESTIAENEGITQATVSRNTAASAELTVVISSSTSGVASADTPITIPAGASSVTFDVYSVDDAIVGGDRSTQLTVTASGHNSASQTVTVADDDVAQLTVTLGSDSATEGGAAVSGTVTRNTPTGRPLIVSLAVDDASELAVQSQVTIPAGQSSITVTASAVNDDRADGAQAVGVTATASGHAASTAVTSVIDDDVPRLSLTLADASISENGGTTTATVTRNTDLTSALSFLATVSDASEAQVPTLVTFTAGQPTATFTVTGIDEAIVDTDQLISISVSLPGFQGDTESLIVTDDEAPLISLSLSTDSIGETDGVATATVTRQGGTDDVLAVHVSVSNELEAIVSNVVTIPAGNASVTFPVTAIDDAIADGDQSIQVTVSSPGFGRVNQSLTVTDNDTASIHLSLLEGLISEGNGTTVATVTRNTPPVSDLTVTLASNDESEVSIPASVVIPAGSFSRTFVVTAVDDILIDGDQSAEIQAIAEGHVTGVATVIVRSDDSALLDITFAQTELSENGGTVTGTVTRNTPTGSSLSVSLASLDTSEATVPASIVIPAGQTSVTFTVSGVDDSVTDGSISTDITAAATDHESDRESIVVTDDDMSRLFLSVSATSVGESAGTLLGTITRNTPTTEALAVSVVSSDTSELTVASSVTIPAGAILVTFPITVANDSLVDGTSTVDVTVSSNGFQSATESIRVTDDDLSISVTAGLSGSGYAVGQIIPIWAQVSGAPAGSNLAVSTSFSVSNAPSPIRPISLHDDGRHNDGQAGDHQFAAAFYQATIHGNWTMTVTVSGEAPDGSSINGQQAVSFAVATMTDSDVDQLADLWEIREVGNLTTLTSHLDDTDTDGLTHIQEFELGLSPVSNDSDGTGPVDSVALASDLNPREFSYQNSQITGLVFDDFDTDGLQDAGEPPAANRMIFVDINGSGAFDSGEPVAYSGVDGQYSFSELPYGEFDVRIKLAAEGEEQTLPGPRKILSSVSTIGYQNGVSGLDRPSAIAIARDGKRIIVGEDAGSNVYAFLRDTSNGTIQHVNTVSQSQYFNKIYNLTFYINDLAIWVPGNTYNDATSYSVNGYTGVMNSSPSRHFDQSYTAEPCRPHITDCHNERQELIGPAHVVFSPDPRPGRSGRTILSVISDGVGSSFGAITDYGSNGDIYYWEVFHVVESRETVGGNATIINSAISNARYMSVSPDGKFAYVTGDTTTVWRCNVTPYQLVQSFSSVGEVVLSPNGANAYAVSGNLTIWDRNASSGVLSNQRVISDSGINGLQNASRVVVSDDGTTVYVHGRSSISTFARSTTTGDLEFSHVLDLGGTAATNGLVVSPDGKNVYAAVPDALGIFESSELVGVHTVSVGTTANTGRNFGVSVSGAQIHGSVYIDSDSDGTRDEGESPIPFATIFLDQNDNGNLDGGEETVESMADGSFPFYGLAAGTYRPVLVAPTGFDWTAPNTPPSVTLTSSGVVQGQDLGVSASGAASIVVSETGSTTTVAETGTVDSFTVALNRQPTSDVVLNVSVGSVNEVFADQSTLTFTRANWDAAQTVTLTGLNDVVADQDVVSSITVSVVGAESADEFDSVPSQLISVTTNNDDVAGFTVTETAGTSVSETGTSDTFSVALNSEPASNVVISVTNGDITEMSVDRTVLTFTPGNWDTAQTVTVTGADDVTVDGQQTSTIILAVVENDSSDAFDDFLDQTVVVTTDDDDVAGFSVQQTSGTSVSESGTTDTFTIVLDRQPVGDVVISVGNGDSSEVSLDRTELTFTAATWSTPQTVTVTGVDDPTVDGTLSTTVTLKIVDDQSAAAFAFVSDQTVIVTTSDDDVAGFSVVQTDGTSVSEPATTDSFTVVLNRQPLSDVVIQITNPDATELSVNLSTLTFTSENWDTAQTVTVIAANDPTVDGNQTTALTLSVVDGDSALAFRTVADRSVVVTTVDDDVPGFTITESSGTSVNESGTTDTFTLVLNRQPLSNVVLNILNGDTSEVSLTQTAVMFTPQNWSSAQTVTVTGVDDSKVDGNLTTTLTISVNDSASADAFDRVADQAVTQLRFSS